MNAIPARRQPVLERPDDLEKVNRRELRLQVGGTLDPRRHIYIERPEDAELFRLLLEGEFCNVLTSRQMGKSSLMARTALRLGEHHVRYVAIDLAGELGSPASAQDWYLGLLEKISRDLDLALEIDSWWRRTGAETPNQKLLRFFRDELRASRDAPVVIFLDEIDSTLKLPFTDDLFTALRTTYNERPLVSAYRGLCFCLLGVATPNELVRDRRTTPYNVGSTLQLRDFDIERDDLAALIHILGPSTEIGRALLERILYWTGGQPYLTTRLCEEVARNAVQSPADVDRHVETSFADLDRVAADVHFQQILRFVDTRLHGRNPALEIYRRVRQRERDQSTLPYAQLKLSGLVKRTPDGLLDVRNPIYGKIFDEEWIQSVTPPDPAPRQTRPPIFSRTALASTASLITLAIALSGWNMSLRRQVSALIEPRAGVLVHALDQHVRGIHSTEPLIIPRSVQDFVVVLLSADTTSPHYSVEIRDSDDRRIWLQDGVVSDGSGEISLILSQRFLPPGEYRIDLLGSDRSGREPIATYALPIRYQ